MQFVLCHDNLLIHTRTSASLAPTHGTTLRQVNRQGYSRPESPAAKAGQPDGNATTYTSRIVLLHCNILYYAELKMEAKECANE
ncbi:MAG: hypothetical protein WCD32_08405 [Azonexus sp.]